MKGAYVTKQRLGVVGYLFHSLAFLQQFASIVGDNSLWRNRSTHPDHVHSITIPGVRRISLYRASVICFPKSTKIPLRVDRCNQYQ